MSKIVYRIPLAFMSFCLFLTAMTVTWIIETQMTARSFIKYGYIQISVDDRVMWVQKPEVNSTQFSVPDREY